MSMRLA